MATDAAEALYARLAANVAVAALVSTRIYPGRLPQNPTFPAITYSNDGEERQSTFGGAGALPGTLYSIDCWGGPTYASALGLAKAVRLALDGAENWTGGSGPAITVQASILEGQRDIYEDDVNIFRKRLDVRLWWQEQAS